MACSTAPPNCRKSSRAGSRRAAGRRARISSNCCALARAGRSALLIAPTGAGKTLAGFLPTLVELSGVRDTLGRLPPPLSGGRVGEGGRASSSRIDGRPPPLTPPRKGEGNRPRLLAAADRTRKRLISTGRGIRRAGGLHTLYISPLKALAVDIARNLERPVAEMGAADPHRDPHRRHAGARSASASAAIRPTSCSPRPSSSRCCSPPTTRRSCSARSGA